MRPRYSRAFTLVELLVVIAIVALLIGVLLPALGRAKQASRDTASGSNLRQLGIGIELYKNDYDRELPQLRVDANGDIARRPEGDNIGALFGGKLGTLPALGIDRIGAERRPLNTYVHDGDVPDDDAPGAREFKMDLFEDPSDRGTESPQLAFFPGVDRSSMYDLLGTSYNLNDHALDDDPFAERYPTLIPKEGGRPPRVSWPTRVWLLADQAVYNYDNGSNAQMYWRRPNRVTSAMLFWDGHVKASVDVPEGVVQTTGDYTFLPNEDWLDQFEEPTP
ncbi:MAG: type II secretion system protein [Planctomycetota bacterium]